MQIPFYEQIEMMLLSLPDQMDCCDGQMET
jgi:hypothetical protein